MRDTGRRPRNQRTSHNIFLIFHPEFGRNGFFSGWTRALFEITYPPAQFSSQIPCHHCALSAHGDARHEIRRRAPRAIENVSVLIRPASLVQRPTSIAVAKSAERARSFADANRSRTPCSTYRPGFEIETRGASFVGKPILQTKRDHLSGHAWASPTWIAPTVRGAGRGGILPLCKPAGVGRLARAERRAHRRRAGHGWRPRAAQPRGRAAAAAGNTTFIR